MSPKRAAALRVLATLAALGAVVAGALAARPAGSGGADLLPDLDQRAPADLVVRRVGKRYRLGFTSRVVNTGRGPLVLRSEAIGAGRMRADQFVTTADGGERKLPGAGEVRYHRGAGHEHWHLMGVQRFLLLRADGGSTRRRDRKSGLCLGDRQRAAGGQGGPLVFGGRCGLRQPGRRTVEQGLSPGWTDPYPPHVEGQEIDITGLPRGRYMLVHRFDPYGRLLETDESDNAASVAIALRGRGRARVRVLRVCEDAPRCRA